MTEPATCIKCPEFYYFLSVFPMKDSADKCGCGQVYAPISVYKVWHINSYRIVSVYTSVHILVSAVPCTQSLRKWYLNVFFCAKYCTKADILNDAHLYAYISLISPLIAFFIQVILHQNNMHILPQEFYFISDQYFRPMHVFKNTLKNYSWNNMI